VRYVGELRLNQNYTQEQRKNFKLSSAYKRCFKRDETRELSGEYTS